MCVSLSTRSSLSGSVGTVGRTASRLDGLVGPSMLGLSQSLLVCIGLPRFVSICLGLSQPALVRQLANTGPIPEFPQYRPIPGLAIFCGSGINAKEALRQRIQSNWDGQSKGQTLANERALARKLTRRSAEP